MKSILILLLLSPLASALTLGWNRNPETNIAGYIVSYGTVSGTYTTDLPLTPDTKLLIPELPAGVTYYFVVRAKNTEGLISGPSAEIVFAPATPPTPPSAPTGFRVVEIETSSNMKDWEAVAYVPLLKEYADRRFVRARITELQKP